jgi:hypothetical protein
MKIRIDNLRQLIREALGGGAAAGGLALYDWSDARGAIRVVLYSPAEILGDVDRFRRGAFLHDEDDEGIVKGYARFKQPDHPCNGAWEVTSIAGRGLGKLLYGLGYELTPNGRLMPDRMYTSGEARSAWSGAAGKGLKGFPLDDAGAPVDKQLTPDEPEDDCEVQKPIEDGGPDPLLDVAYEGGAVGAGSMRSEHQTTVRALSKEGIDQDSFESWLRLAGGLRFERDFSSAM